MSTTIKSRLSTRTVQFEPGDRVAPGTVRVIVDVGPDAYVSRADFLAAVEAECGVRCVPADAVVIERAEVERVAREIRSVVIEQAVTAERAREVGILYLLIAEQRANPPAPPVSDEDVETLVAVMRTIPDGYGNRERVARALLATGRIEVKP